MPSDYIIVCGVVRENAKPSKRLEFIRCHSKVDRHPKHNRRYESPVDLKRIYTLLALHGGVYYFAAEEKQCVNTEKRVSSEVGIVI